MAEIYIPTLHTFAMKNTFTGSCGLFRFKITPNVVMIPPQEKEVDFAQSSMTAEIWHSELCYEKSTVEETKTFPMSEEGRLEMKNWLEESV